jgi:hypothetical protein
VDRTPQDGVGGEGGIPSSRGGASQDAQGLPTCPDSMDTGPSNHPSEGLGVPAVGLYLRRWATGRILRQNVEGWLQPLHGPVSLKLGSTGLGHQREKVRNQQLRGWEPFYCGKMGARA